MPRRRTKKSPRKQLMIGLSAMALAAVVGLPKLLDGDETPIPPDAPAPEEWELNDPSLSGPVVLDDPELGSSTETATDDTGPRPAPRLVKDLLAQVGSRLRSRELPDPFWRPAPPPPAEPEVDDTPAEGPADATLPAEEASQSRPPETPAAPPRPTPWPRLRVSLVYVTGDVFRAVVAGRIVGVGDAVGSGVVKAIEPEGIEVAFDRGTVRYALGSDVPLARDAVQGGVGWNGDSKEDGSEDN